MKGKIDEEKKFTVSLLADVFYDKESIQWKDLKEIAFYLWDVAYLKGIWSKRNHIELKVISLYMYKIYNLLMNQRQNDASLAKIEDDSNCKEIMSYMKEMDKHIISIKLVEFYRNHYVTETFYKAVNMKNLEIHDDFRNKYGSTMTTFIFALHRSSAESYRRCKEINLFLEPYKEKIIYSKKKHQELPFENCLRIY